MGWCIGLCQTSEKFGEPYPPRAAFAAGLPGDAHRAGSRGGRRGTALGIPAMAGDWPSSCDQFKRDIERHVRPAAPAWVRESSRGLAAWIRWRARRSADVAV